MGQSTGGPQRIDVMEYGTPEQISAYQKWKQRDTEIRNIRADRDKKLEGVTDEEERISIMLDSKNLLIGMYKSVSFNSCFSFCLVRGH